MYIANRYFEKVAKENGFYPDELKDKIAQSGSIQDINEIPEKFRKLFVTSHDITPQQHIKMQAAFQQWTDNAVSKTVNFPHNATKEDVKEAYMLSYDTACKGVTVYRDGSRDLQVLNISTPKDESSSEQKDEKTKPRVRPSRTIGYTYAMNTGCQKMYVTINEDANGACEVFMRLGKSGGCPNSQTEAIGRLASLALRSNVEIDSIIEQLKGIRCPNPVLSENGPILSCADAVAKALEIYKREKEMPGLFAQPKVANGDESFEHKPGDYLLAGQSHKYGSSSDDHNGACPECPECSAMLSFEEGCQKCNACGYSKCS
jgi:ribonucleoside-diphosphate reductase alpha chain